MIERGQVEKQMAQMRSETELEEGEFVSDRRGIANDEHAKAIQNDRGHERRIDRVRRRTGRVITFDGTSVRRWNVFSLADGDVFE